MLTSSIKLKQNSEQKELENQKKEYQGRSHLIYFPSKTFIQIILDYIASNIKRCQT